MSKQCRSLSPLIKHARILISLVVVSILLVLATPCIFPAFGEPSQPITITIKVDGYSKTLPSLQSGTDFTAGEAVKADPRYMVDEQGNQPLASLIEQKESEGYQLVWRSDSGEVFDWFETPVTTSITVTGTFEQADYQVRVSFNDDATDDLEVAVPRGSSFKDAYGTVPETPSKKGHSFVRWVNAADNSTFDFTAPVTASTTVYALFEISEPDQVVTVDANMDVPQTLSGRCYIGATWSVHPAQFSVSGFTGGLEGCSGTGSCSLPSAAAPSYTWADYTATLASVDIEAGLVVYDVTITPPGAASPNGPRNSLGLIGYQTVYFRAEVQKNFGGYLELQKTSANPGLSEGNSTYTLAGAVFGVYDKQGKRLGELITDESGATERSPLLPVGTYTIKEEYAPDGFAPAADKNITVTAGTVTKSTINDIPQSALIDLLLQKYDTETTINVPLGAATLEGARFKVSYYDAYPIVPHMVKLAAERIASQSSSPDIPNSNNPNMIELDQSILEYWGEPTRSWIFETDAEGTIAFSEEYFVEGDEFFFDHEGNIVLPLGTIVVEEIQAPTGYLPLTEPFSVVVPDNGDDVHVETWHTLDAPEQVKRGDLSFTKAREGSMERLANVPFKITSQTTGESHVLVTDENGMASTEASWTPHSQNTNAGTSSEDGIWFGNDIQGNTAEANDELGALPYDTYTVEELPCQANEGMVPVSFEVTITRDKVTLDIGTIDNKPYTPEIGGEVDKRQTLLDKEGAFSYTIDYRSTSATWADEFTMTDTLTCAEENLAHLEYLETPVCFEDYDGLMNVWYKTNLTDSSKDLSDNATNAPDDTSNTSDSSADSDADTDAATNNGVPFTEAGSSSESEIEESPNAEENNNETANACASNPYNPDNPNNQRMFDFEGWKLWQKDISTLESQTLKVEDLSLTEGEWVVALAFEHGRVEEGFGTLPQDAAEWDRRERYEENDTLESLEEVKNRNYTFDTAQAVGTTKTEQSESHTYAPAVLFMQATEETLQYEGIDLYNDAAIDIYRNRELHDEDKDSVKQTTPEPDAPETPLEELISNLPKTADPTTGIFVTILAGLCLGIALLAKRKIGSDYQDSINRILRGK